ncbi:MAG: hypothetical protein KDA92_27275, partial [Planctomycetales bacterium]|nr:hypothetical protein [Planctomycetales bacterium]
MTECRSNEYTPFASLVLVLVLSETVLVLEFILNGHICEDQSYESEYEYRVAEYEYESSPSKHRVRRTTLAQWHSV